MLGVIPGVELLVVLIVDEIGVDQEDRSALLRHAIASASLLPAGTIGERIHGAGGASHARHTCRERCGQRPPGIDTGRRMVHLTNRIINYLVEQRWQPTGSASSS